MADDKACKHCGYQETDHDRGRARLSNGEECRNFDPSVRETARTYTSSPDPLVIEAIFAANDTEVRQLIFERYAEKILSVMAYHLQYRPASLLLAPTVIHGRVGVTSERLSFRFKRNAWEHPRFDNAFAKKVAEHLLTHEKCELLREFHFTILLEGPGSSGSYEHCPAHPLHAVTAK